MSPNLDVGWAWTSRAAGNGTSTRIGSCLMSESISSEISFNMKDLTVTTWTKVLTEKYNELRINEMVFLRTVRVAQTLNPTTAGSIKNLDVAVVTPANNPLALQCVGKNNYNPLAHRYSVGDTSSDAWLLPRHRI